MALDPACVGTNIQTFKCANVIKCVCHPLVDCCPKDAFQLVVKLKLFPCKKYKKDLLN